MNIKILLLRLLVWIVVLFSMPLYSQIQKEDSVNRVEFKSFSPTVEAVIEIIAFADGSKNEMQDFFYE